MSKKVLVITYYWPPAGGPGVQRWLKFVKYLPDFGVEPIVYTPQDPHYPLRDESLIAEIPDAQVNKLAICTAYFPVEGGNKTLSEDLCNTLVAEFGKAED